MKKILVPVDFSEASERSLEFTTNLFKEDPIDIVLLHVVTMPATVGAEYTMVNAQLIQDLLTEMIENAESKLSTLAEKYAQENVKFTKRVETGNLTQWFKYDVENLNPFMIIMGTTGATGLKEILIGSNTERAIRFAKCPVVAVPASAEMKDVKNIVVAYDDDEIGVTLLEEVKNLQTLTNSTIHFLWVNTPHELENENVVTQNLQELTKENKFENFTINVRRNFNPYDGILNFSHEVGADMIAMFTHGRTGLAHLFFHSLTEKVANHSNIPIFSLNVKKNKPKKSEIKETVA
ncbi:MAG: universal stress protein [bacterium]|nr:universal stress protein [bacterium]